MPANLTPEYFAAEREYKAAKDLDEKLAALEKMLSVIPKHKGTEKLQASIKRKIANFKQQIQKQQRTVRKGYAIIVKKEGAGQIFLIGAPNVGKSQLLTQLTNARPEVSDYPYTTRLPQPGMMIYQNIQIQLVDTPPISKEYTEKWLPGLIRTADAVAVLADLSADNWLDQIDTVISELQHRKIQLVGNTLQVSSTLQSSMAFIKTIIVGNKIDLPNSQENFKLLTELYGSSYPVLCVSARDGKGIPQFKEYCYSLLDIIRVYCKSPGKQPDLNDPVILKKGSNVKDFARAIHKELAENLNYARIWSSNLHQGQRIPQDYQLCDEDIVELHL